MAACEAEPAAVEGEAMRRVFVLLCVLCTGWPALGHAQTPLPRPTATPMVLPQDTLERVVTDFRDPCQAVLGYVIELGINPLAGGPAVATVREQSWDLLAAALGALATTPSAAQ